MGKPKEKPKKTESIIIKFVVDTKEFRKKMAIVRKQIRLLKREMRTIKIG